MAVKDLHILFEGEKDRFLDSQSEIHSIYYNKASNTIQYKTKANTLTMEFERTGDKSTGYHREEIKKSTGFGDKIVEFEGGDAKKNAVVMETAEKTPEFKRVPEPLKDIVRSYAYESKEKEGLEFSEEEKKKKVSKEYDR